MDSTPILAELTRTGLRFVVVGSTARALCGEQVGPNDLDIVVDDAPAQRRLLLDALVAVEARLLTRGRLAPMSSGTVLAWAWGFTAVTVWGPIDVVVRFIDGSAYVDHAQRCIAVAVEDRTVWCHPTRRAA
jgi:hypothetical protein